jgi:hypothetical protein
MGKRFSPAKLASLVVVLASIFFLTHCTITRTGNDIPLPVITVAPASASLAAGGSLQFTATVVTPLPTTITWNVNGILGGNSTLGTVNSSGLYVAPAVVPSPATVTVAAVSSAETSPSGSAIVTITTPVVNAVVAVAPTNASVPAGTTVQFSSTVTGTTNSVVAWYVDGVLGGNSTVGTLSSTGLYTAPTAVPNPPTVVVTATSQANTSDSASTTVTLLATNAAPLFVNFGPNGNTGNPNTAYYNGLFTTVTVCLPNTADCQIIPDVLVDTGSVGLRVLNSVLTTVPATELGTEKDSAGDQIQECVQFRDTSYVWGPVLIADVRVGGELASAVPIQVIGDNTYGVPEAGCLNMGPGPNLDTVAALGANGILGVGTFVQDCGLDCSGGQTFPAYPYYVCPNNVCQTAYVPLVQQVANPVAFFATDNNGVEIFLPSIPSAGAATLPYFPPLEAYSSATQSSFVSAGLLIFGVGTESNNALPSGATIYATDSSGDFSKVVFNGVSYTSGAAFADRFTHTAGGFPDTGSNALFVSDQNNLDIADCADNPYYCPNSTYSLPLTTYGANGTSKAVTLSIANADQLFENNPGFAAFNNLGAASGTGVATDYFDLGLPFFFGRTVFVGIAGTTVPTGATAPNGYFAF